MVFKKLKDYGNMVMFSQTVFSLPFGLIAMFWAAGGIPSVSIFFWIVVALVAARNGANAFNRIADHKIDGENPRTKDRHLPSGRISLKEAWLLCGLCFAVMALAAWQLNLLCLLLLPAAVGIFIFYSYSKRFTWLCHFILGAACGGAPVGAWIAVTGAFALLPFMLGAAVCFWVAGFDILYATQDIEFDRRTRLHSIPARFGERAALWISSGCHILSVLILLLIAFIIQGGFFYYFGLAIIAYLLTLEHINVIPSDQGQMKRISYQINQIIGIVFFITAAADFFMF